MQQLGMQQPPMPVHLQQSQMPFAVPPPVVVQQPPTEAAGASISHGNVTPSVVTSSAGVVQVCPITPQAYQKQERRVLKILDPRTLEEINVLGSKTSTPPQSDSSSSQATQ